MRGCKLQIITLYLLWPYYYSCQTAADQKDIKLRDLSTNVSILERQLNDMRTHKTKVEKERESATEEKEKTKVCTYLQCLFHVSVI